MLVALGECYEKLNQLVEAKKVSEIEPLRTEWESAAWMKGGAICDFSSFWYLYMWKSQYIIG